MYGGRLVVVSHADIRLQEALAPARKVEVLTMLRNPLERQVGFANI